MRFYTSHTNARNNEVSGSVQAGNAVHTRGWDAGVKVTPRDRNADEFDVYMTTGSHESGHDVLLGTVRDTPDGPVWTPANQER